MIAPHVAAGTSKAKLMLRTRTKNTFPLLEGAVLAAAEGDGATASQMKGWGFNLAAFPRETLYQLQDGVTAELHTREGHAL